MVGPADVNMHERPAQRLFCRALRSTTAHACFYNPASVVHLSTSSQCSSESKETCLLRKNHKHNLAQAPVQEGQRVGNGQMLKVYLSLGTTLTHSSYSEGAPELTIAYQLTSLVIVRNLCPQAGPCRTRILQGRHALCKGIVVDLLPLSRRR